MHWAGQTTFTRDPYGNLLTATDASGATFSTTRNERGAPVSLTDALGKSSQIAYDNLNRPVETTDALNGKFTFQYDSLGRLTRTTDPLSRTSTRVYDSMGRVIRSTDAAGGTTVFTYDKLGNLTKVTDALGAVTSYSWSPGACNCSTAGTLSAIGNAVGQGSSFTYNSRRQVSSATGPAKDSMQFSYDPAGNPAQRTDPNGAGIQLAFNARHRVIQRQYPDGTSDAFTYDANGNLLTATNQNVSLTYTYDAGNRLSSVSDSRFPAPTLYTYDKVGRRASMTDPYGGKTTYTYDANGRLTSLAGPDGSTTTFSYDANGRRSAIILGNGIRGSYQRDAAGQLVSVSYISGGVTLDQFSYTFDKLGNRLSMTTSAGTHTYQHDALSRLTGATHPADPNEAYTYDRAGNRLSTAAPEPGAAGATAYTYDPLNRLSSVTLPDQSTGTYKYDAFGRRIEKSIAGVAIRYLHDGANVLLEQDDSGAPFVARYTYGPRVDEPLVMEFNGNSYYYVADGARNVVYLTDATAATVQSYDTDSFGRLLSAPGAVPNPYIFAGRALDPETGLYYFRSRYYDPETGRFITQDPFSPAMLLAAGQGGSGAARRILDSYLRSPLLLNAYVYAIDNPTNRLDPYGTQSDPVDSFGTDFIFSYVDNSTPFDGDPSYLPYTPSPDLIAASNSQPNWVDQAGAVAAAAAQAVIDALKSAWEALKNAFWNIGTKDSPIPNPLTDPQDAPNAYSGAYGNMRDTVLSAAYNYSSDPDVNNLINKISAIDNQTGVSDAVKAVQLSQLLEENRDVLKKIGIQGPSLPKLPDGLKCKVP